MATNDQPWAYVSRGWVKSELRLLIRGEENKFFELLGHYEDGERKRFLAREAFLDVATFTRDPYDPSDTSKEQFAVNLSKQLIGMFGEVFFTGFVDSQFDAYEGMTLDQVICANWRVTPLAFAYCKHRDEILASSAPTVKSANKTASASASASASAAQIRQALVRARGDPKAAAKMIMASGRLQDTYKGTKWEEIANEFRDEDHFDQDALGELIDWAKQSRIADPWQAFWNATKKYPDLYDRLYSRA